MVVFFMLFYFDLDFFVGEVYCVLFQCVFVWFFQVFVCFDVEYGFVQWVFDCVFVDEFLCQQCVCMWVYVFECIYVVVDVVDFDFYVVGLFEFDWCVF